MNNFMGDIPVFGANPLSAQVTQTDFMRSLLIPWVLKLAGYPHASVLPGLGNPMLSPYDAGLIRDVTTPAYQMQRDLLAGDTFMNAGATASSLLHNMRAPDWLVSGFNSAVAPLLANQPGAASAAGRMLAGVLDSDMYRTLTGGSPTRIFDQAFSQRNLFMRSSLIGQTMTPLYQQSSVESAKAWATTMQQYLTYDGVVADTGIVGTFKTDEAAAALLGMAARGRSGITDTPTPQRDIVKRSMNLMNAMASAMGTNDSQELLRTADRILGTDWAAQDSDKITRAFQKIGQFAKAINTNSADIVQAMSSVSELTRLQTGRELGVLGAQDVVFRGLSAAEAAGVRSSEGRQRYVQAMQARTAEGMGSVGMNALTYLMANRHLLTDADRNWLDTQSAPDAASAQAMLRRYFGSATTGMLADSTTATALYNDVLTVEQRQHIQSQMLNAQPQEIQRQLMGAASAALWSTARGVWETAGGSAHVYSDGRAGLALRALDRAGLFSADAQLDTQMRARARSIYQSNLQQGYTAGQAWERTQSALTQMGGYDEGLLRLRGDIDREAAATLLAGTDRSGFITGRAAALASAAGSRFDYGRVQQLLRSGNVGEAQAILRGSVSAEQLTAYVATASNEFETAQRQQRDTDAYLSYIRGSGSSLQAETELLRMAGGAGDTLSGTLSRLLGVDTTRNRQSDTELAAFQQQLTSVFGRKQAEAWLAEAGFIRTQTGYRDVGRDASKQTAVLQRIQRRLQLGQQGAGAFRRDSAQFYAGRGERASQVAGFAATTVLNDFNLTADAYIDWVGQFGAGNEGVLERIISASRAPDGSWWKTILAGLGVDTGNEQEMSTWSTQAGTRAGAIKQIITEFQSQERAWANAGLTDEERAAKTKDYFTRRRDDIMRAGKEVASLQAEIEASKQAAASDKPQEIRITGGEIKLSQDGQSVQKVDLSGVRGGTEVAP